MTVFSYVLRFEHLCKFGWEVSSVFAGDVSFQQKVKRERGRDRKWGESVG